MRHNNNGRRFRGRGNNGSGQGNHHHHNGHSGGGNNNRRVNPRVQTFDSNGPEVRVRGNAYQINEKYLALAKDAASAGDRILAESYLQHAEHYQRMINEMSEEYNKHQAQFAQPQPGMEDQQQADPSESEQPSVDGLADLDQPFLRRPAIQPAQEMDQPAVKETENA